MKKNIPETDWSKYESIPFAVVFWSSQLGWITMSQPDSPEAAHKSYEACDSNKKMLLNFGMIVRQAEPLTRSRQPVTLLVGEL